MADLEHMHHEMTDDMHVMRMGSTTTACPRTWTMQATEHIRGMTITLI